MSSTCFITYCGTGSRVIWFLVFICPFIRLMNLQPPWKFVGVPKYIDPCKFSYMVLGGHASSWISAYVPNSTLQCLDWSKLQYFIMVLWEYYFDELPTAGKSFIHSSTNMIISMTTHPKTLLNGRVLLMALFH